MFFALKLSATFSFFMINNSGHNFAINKKGEELPLEKIMKNWEKNFLGKENSKEAWHLVFSLDEDSLSPKQQRAFVNSVKEIMNLNFLGHKYAYVLRNHQAKPHIHIVVNKYNILENKKIHFAKKSDIKYFLRL